MTIDLLLAQFEQVASAPGAIQRLRRFVLDLAVRGKLSDQYEDDVPAALLIQKIASAPRDAPLAPRYRSLVVAPLEQLPFEVPQNWEWARLGYVSDYIQRGKSPKYSSATGPPVVSQKCVRWEGLDLAPSKAITAASLESYEPIRFLRDGDLLWNSTGTGTIGRVSRVVDPPERLVCDSHVTIVRCSHLDSEYVRCWLRSDHVYGTIEGDASGSTNQVELTLQMALSQPIPLPPLAEQRRIVAKVSELMALCDELEKVSAEIQVERGRLLDSLLQSALNEAQGATLSPS